MVVPLCPPRGATPQRWNLSASTTPPPCISCYRGRCVGGDSPKNAPLTIGPVACPHSCILYWPFKYPSAPYLLTYVCARTWSLPPRTTVWNQLPDATALSA